MPSVYLSPSLQEYNPVIIGGNEEYYMNLLADAMIPYLDASGISYGRNNPNQTLSQAIQRSNEGSYDLHLALHSNSSPDYLAGTLQGPDVYYYPGSPESEKAADIIASNLEAIYPDPSLVTTLPGPTLAELRRTSAPAVLLETAYHDNYEDAQWIADNIKEIAANLVLSLTQYFDIPFVDPYLEAM